MTAWRGGETRFFKALEATLLCENLPAAHPGCKKVKEEILFFTRRNASRDSHQCESRMEPESAEVASRARDAARDAATASVEAATLDAAVEFERAALRARRDVSGARADVRKTRVGVPRTPREAETRARRTREAAAEERRARETARMRAAGVDAAARGGVRGVGSAAALDAERRARWRTHEARWCAFCRDEDASALAAPFPSSGADLLLALRSVFRNSDSDATRDSDARRSESSSKSSSKSFEALLQPSRFDVYSSPEDSKPSSSRLALKRAFRAAALRWHPDKFVQTFAARLAAVPAAPRAALERRVAETFRDVREAYERMERNVSTNDDD